jgi:bacterioferritin-associated ferredoxin
LYVCICKAITRDDACRLARQGKCSSQEIVEEFGLDCEDACGRCIRSMERFMLAQAEPPAQPAPSHRPLPRELVQS